MTVVFCPKCDTYLPSTTTVCPICGQERPVEEKLQATWSAPVEGVPVAPGVAVGEGLLVAVHDSGSAPQQGTLNWLRPGDGKPVRAGQLLERGVLVSGVKPVRFWKSDRFKETAEVSETSAVLVLISTYSAEPIARQGAVIALDETGAEQWRWTPGVQAVSAVGVSGERAWVTTNTGLLVGLGLADGKEEARFNLGVTPSLAEPGVDEASVYVPCRGPVLVAVGLDGQVQWRFDLPKGWLDRTPALQGEWLYTVANLAGVIVALERATGREVWRVEPGSKRGKRLSPPVADGERLYVGAEDGLYALALEDGRQVWHFPAQRRIEAAPLVVGETVYVAGHDHHLYALEAATGREMGRYELARRVEVAPALVASPVPSILVADQGGTITAIRPLFSPAEYEAAGQWEEAAAGWAALGRLERAAELFQAHRQPFKAAQLWQAAGKLEEAAKQYQAGGRWLRAAEIWEELGRPREWATALQRQAESLTNQLVSDEERAQIWGVAAAAWRYLKEPEAAEACQIEVARYRHLPHITVEVQHDALKLKHWTSLHFIVRNVGYSRARHLFVRAGGGEFRGQLAETQQIISLGAGAQSSAWLDVQPQSSGKVPLRVTIEYQDEQGGQHSWSHTTYLQVSGD